MVQTATERLHEGNFYGGFSFFLTDQSVRDSSSWLFLSQQINASIPSEYMQTFF